MAVRFSNNFSTLLAGSISSSSTTIPLQGVVGFPTLGPDDRTYLTIDSGGSPPTIEVVKVTAVNLATSEVTVVRGQDGTSASAFSSGAVVELRLTAALLNDAAAVQYSDIGTDPNQVPLNQYLGSMAYQDLDAVSITGGSIDGVTIGGSSAGAITGTTITGTSFVSSGDMTFGDNDKAIFGAGSDLQIYHDGSNSYITESGTGNLRISGTLLQLNDASFNKYLLGSGDSVTLYNADSPKLATTATGINVTGTVTADGLTVDGNGLIQANTGAKLEIKSTDNFINAGEVIGSVDFISADYNHPAQPIKVQLEARAFNNLGNGDLYISTTESDTKTDRIRISYNGDVSFYEDTGTTPKFFWDASEERLGIGTTSPAVPLDVRTSLSATANPQWISDFYAITSGQTDITYGGGIRLYTKNINGNYWPAAVAAVNDAGGSNLSSLAFYTATSGPTLNEAMRINWLGNVGIGTTSPTNVGGYHSVSVNGTTGSLFDSYYGGTLGGRIQAYSSGYFISAQGASLPLILGTNNTEAMRINSLGNVGIGTSSPGATLDVAGDIEVNSTFALNGEETSTSTTSATQIASFAVATYGGAKFVVTAHDTVAGERYIVEILVTHDGTTAFSTEYAQVATSTALATYTVDINSGNVRLLATAASSNATNYRVVETLIDA